MRHDENQKHPPEMLAAFVDGELDARQRAAVEKWLAADPEARADVEAQRRIAVLWQACRPAEPDETAYRSALQHIEERLLVPTPVLSSRRFRLPWVLGFAALPAAAWSAWIIGILFVVVNGFTLYQTRSPRVGATA